MSEPAAHSRRSFLATRNFVSDVQEALVVDAPDAIRYVLPSDLSGIASASISARIATVSRAHQFATLAVTHFSAATRRAV